MKQKGLREDFGYRSDLGRESGEEICSREWVNWKIRLMSKGISLLKKDFEGWTRTGDGLGVLLSSQTVLLRARR